MSVSFPYVASVPSLTIVNISDEVFLVAPSYDAKLRSVKLKETVLLPLRRMGPHFNHYLVQSLETTWTRLLPIAARTYLWRVAGLSA